MIGGYLRSLLHALPCQSTGIDMLREMFMFKNYAEISIVLLGIYPKDTDVVRRRAICTPMFIAVLSTIAKSWKELRCPSTDDWIKKICSIDTMEYYSAIRKNDFSTFAPTYTALVEIMLREISQSEKDNYHMVSLIYGA